ncbi:MAG TPA: efflux RND transporter periplasmic adaptor subunit [Thermoanaerobaculia bacterium]|nr:efflux RND transporter periplasmic adaptor subunit [Thermoanaerobaculia bacterium]
MQTKLIPWIVAAAFSPFLLAGCGGDDPASAAGRGKNGQGPEAEAPARDVRLARAEEGRLARTVAVSGTLAADEQAELGIKVAGRIQQVMVDIGDPVRRGQPIARIIPTDLELRVVQARTALEQARARLGIPAAGPDRMVDPQETAVVKQAVANLKQATLTRDRMARLLEEKLIPPSDFDAAEAAMSVADARYQEAIEEVNTRQGLLGQRRSELALAERQLADSVVTAPFDGRISERLVSAGDYVPVGGAVAVLVRVNPLRLRLGVPEREAVGVKVGLPVQLSVEGDPATYTGRVARISPAFSEANRTLLVEAEVPNPDGRLKPGSFAKAEIVIEASDPVVLVPASSIVSFAGIEKVIGVEAGKAVEKRVRTGRRSGDQVEITDGVKAGEAVVVQPGNLVGGQPVKVLG